MSAGWEYDFSLTEQGRVQVVFDWTLTIDNDYESDEYGEMVVSLDGDETVIQRLTGNGNGGSDNVASGIAQVVSWPSVSPQATHTIALGVYNNEKTYNNEVSTVQIDNVVISSFTPNSGPAPTTGKPTLAPTPVPQSAPAPTPAPVAPPTGTIVDATFETGTDGFVYQDDVFKVSYAPYLACLNLLALIGHSDPCFLSITAEHEQSCLCKRAARIQYLQRFGWA